MARSAAADTDARGDRARLTRQLRELVARTWDGHASANSAGYRLPRMFREQVTAAIVTFVLSECYEADASFDYLTVRRREGPIWKLVTERPMHLLDPQYSSWDALLINAMDRIIERANARAACRSRGRDPT